VRFGEDCECGFHDTYMHIRSYACQEMLCSRARGANSRRAGRRSAIGARFGRVPGSAAGGVYCFGPFRLEAGERRLLRDGQLVPLTSKAFDTLRLLIEGAGLAYAFLGHGPPLVKAANWLSHVELELTGTLWAHWLDLLSRGRNLVRYDARGNGLSDWNPPSITFEDFVADLGTIFDASG